jgi:hypothetical protein
MVHLENVLGCPEQHLKFHIWYLRENGWVYRLENGLLAITASGVDRVLDEGGPGSHRLPQLESAERARARSRVGMNGDNGAQKIDPADAA